MMVIFLFTQVNGCWIHTIIVQIHLQVLMKYLAMLSKKYSFVVNNCIMNDFWFHFKVCQVMQFPQWLRNRLQSAPPQPPPPPQPPHLPLQQPLQLQQVTLPITSGCFDDFSKTDEILMQCKTIAVADVLIHTHELF